MWPFDFWFAENDLQLLDSKGGINLKIEHKNISKKYKLTVAKGEVRIKLPTDIDKVLEDKLINLSMQVAMQIYTNFTFTQRGYWKFHNGYWRISLQGERRKEILNFNEATL